MSISKWITVFIALTLHGCAYDELGLPKPGSIQMLPQSDSTQQINNAKITYILPDNTEEASGTIHGLIFHEYSEGKSTKMERLYVENKGDSVQIERRTDNGVAGSGVIYNVAMNLTSNSEGNVVTFIPKTKKAYQQGLVLPFPIPAFDIESYLATAAIDCKFEVETAYPVESIKANFDRLMTRKSDGVYQLTSQEEDFVIEVQIYPYKHNQSKVLISSRIYNKKAHNGVVNVVKKIGKLKKQIQSVINS